jgi:hypothetical protein
MPRKNRKRTGPVKAIVRLRCPACGMLARAQNLNITAIGRHRIEVVEQRSGGRGVWYYTRRAATKDELEVLLRCLERAGEQVRALLAIEPSTVNRIPERILVQAATIKAAPARVRVPERVLIRTR